MSSRSARLGHSVGEAGGDFLSAFLQAQANKDLREEQELQRENIRTALKYYLDPKTELGPGVMSELGTEYPGLLRGLQPGQGYGLPEEEKLESVNEQKARILKEKLQDPDFAEKFINKEFLGKKDEEPKRPKNITGSLDITDLLGMRTAKTKAAQKAYDKAKRDLQFTTSSEEEYDKQVEELGDKPHDYQLPDDITALADSVEAARTNPEYAAALAIFDPLLNPKPKGSTAESAVDSLFFPLIGEAETGGTETAKAQIKELRDAGYKLDDLQDPETKQYLKGLGYDIDAVLGAWVE